MLFGHKPENVAIGEESAWNTTPLIILAIVLVGLSIYLPEPIKTLINHATSIY
jgi:hypothetical protein